MRLFFLNKSIFSYFTNSIVKSKDIVKTKRFTAKQMKLLTHNGSCKMAAYDENCNRLTTNNNNYLTHKNTNSNTGTNLDDGKTSFTTNIIKSQSIKTTTTMTTTTKSTVVPSSDSKFVDAKNKHALLNHCNEKQASLTAVGDCSNSLINGDVNSKCQCGDNVVKRDLLKSVGKSFRYVS